MPWPRYTTVVIAPVMKDVEVGGAVEGGGMSRWSECYDEDLYGMPCVRA